MAEALARAALPLPARVVLTVALVLACELALCVGLALREGVPEPAP